MHNQIDSYLFEIVGLLKIHSHNAIPKVTEDLMEYTMAHLNKELGVKSFLLNGSYNSQTSVPGYSDIDIIAIFDFGDYELNQKYFKSATLGLDGALNKICKNDIDGYLDMPAFRIYHLSQPDYIIEITPAITTSAMGIYLGKEDDQDYCILCKFAQSIISTNPRLHKKITTYLNQTANGYYSYLVTLLKFWKYSNNIDIKSIAFEIFVYHWFRGTCSLGKYPLKEYLNGVVNLNFKIVKPTESLIDNIIDILNEMVNNFEKCNSGNKLYEMVNPYTRFKIPNELFKMFESIEKQNKITSILKEKLEKITMLY